MTSPIEHISHAQPRLPSSSAWFQDEDEVDFAMHAGHDDEFWDLEHDWLIQGCMQSLHEHRQSLRGTPTVLSPRRRSCSPLAGNTGTSLPWVVLPAPSSSRTTGSPASPLPAVAERDNADEVDGGLSQQLAPDNKFPAKLNVKNWSMMSMVVESMEPEDETDGVVQVSTVDSNTEKLHRIWRQLTDCAPPLSTSNADSGAALSHKAAVHAEEGEDDVDFPLLSIHKKPTVISGLSPNISLETSPLLALLGAGRLLGSVANSLITTDGPVVTRQRPLAIQVGGNLMVCMQVISSVNLPACTCTPTYLRDIFPTKLTFVSIYLMEAVGWL